MSAQDLPDTGALPANAAPLEVVDAALSLLREEKRVFLEGRYEHLETIIASKAALLERLEQVIHSAARDQRILAALKRLIEESRRNEQIIQAARQGLAHARRRLKAIDEMLSGAVAYAEDGTRISSHADQIKGGTRA